MKYKCAVAARPPVRNDSQTRAHIHIHASRAEMRNQFKIDIFLWASRRVFYAYGRLHHHHHHQHRRHIRWAQRCFVCVSSAGIQCRRIKVRTFLLCIRVECWWSMQIDFGNRTEYINQNIFTMCMCKGEQNDSSIDKNTNKIYCYHTRSCSHSLTHSLSLSLSHSPSGKMFIVYSNSWSTWGHTQTDCHAFIEYFAATCWIFSLCCGNIFVANVLLVHIVHR